MIDIIALPAAIVTESLLVVAFIVPVAVFVYCVPKAGFALSLSSIHAVPSAAPASPVLLSKVHVKVPVVAPIAGPTTFPFVI